MKISTRGRYGLRAMVELARVSGRAPVLMSTVAERAGLSRKYLHRLLTELKRAGLVRAVRGAGGGFVLTRPPGEIKLGEILCALEGPLSFVECVADKRACGRSKRCPARRVWQELAGAVGSVLDSATLGDLLAPQGREWAGSQTTRSTRRARAKRSGSRPRQSASRVRRPKAGKK